MYTPHRWLDSGADSDTVMAVIGTLAPPVLAKTATATCDVSFKGGEKGSM
jgi:hypothetical protein